ncbi:MATE family efflux transporter [Clostridium grantii]|nr:MATE family efflux transporter [Clostridium grantii]
MAKKNDLTEGNILKAITKLALPIMGTSFIQMAYNMVDMIWIGRLGSKAVAAIGTAGFFTWLAMAFIIIPKMGAEIGIAQSIGRKNAVETKGYTTHTIQIGIILASIYGVFLLVFRKNLIAFFNLGDIEVIEMSLSYLLIISLGIVFYFINPIFTGILNGHGDSKTPFIINTVGLVANIILDPMLIFGFGPFPALGANGAAIATIFSQFVVTIIFIFFFIRKTDFFQDFHLMQRLDKKIVKSIVNLGLPVAIQSGLFTIFSMFIARIIANWGPVPIAVQKVGSQIEAISWMTAGGFATALSTFVGQNYGAKKWNRIYKGYIISMGIVTILGIAATVLLIFGARPIFSIFIKENDAIAEGIIYLRILGLSQLFMCIEIASAGAFNGIGRTIPPSLVGIIFNGLRIPSALFLSSFSTLGLMGVWWSISMTSVFKGIILTAWFVIFIMKHPEIYKKSTSEILL